MLPSYAEKLLAKILGFGAALTSVVVVSSTVTDPVNTPKLVSLGVVAAAAIGIANANWSKFQYLQIQIGALLGLLFLLSASSAVIFSESPLSQNFYGTYGRNNGLVTYLFLTFIFLSASTLAQQRSFETLAKSLIFAGIVNIIYCGWVILFGDFIGWNNPYGNILGTFGNPNFIGAFLGIFISAYVAYAISPSRSRAWRWSLLIVVPVTVFEIIDSSAIQGRVVTAGGLALVLFSWLRFKVNKVVLGLYSSIATSVGVFAVLGALQIGPLTQFIYKTSVSLRGQYWLAGWNAGQSHPFTGIGMDSFGDWYRRVRDPQAILLPGVNTVVNAAHNVFMDMFAFGGWPLFLAYVSIILFSGYSVVRTFLRLKTFDGTFTALAVAWVGYQVQSLISINQIGLAIWGWLLSGALIAYERVTRIQKSDDSENKKQNRRIAEKSLKSSDSRVVLVSSICALIGLLIALPPFVSDTKWKSAMNAQSLPQLEQSMQASYFNPLNTNRFTTNIRMLEESKLGDLARKYTLEAIEWNPEVYDFWRILYFISKATPQDRELALANMKKLDPLNPDVTAP